MSGVLKITTKTFRLYQKVMIRDDRAKWEFFHSFKVIRETGIFLSVFNFVREEKLAVLSVKVGRIKRI